MASGTTRFRPRCELGPRPEADPWPGDKIGGLPAGVALAGAGGWPACRACGRPMSFLAQFVHAGARLDLGGEGRVLTLWSCDGPGTCDSWDAAGGANAAVVLPAAAGPPAAIPAPEGALVYPEARIVAWESPAEDAPSYRTQLGGPPVWIQSDDEAPPPPWRFVAQIADTQPLTAAPAAPLPAPYGVQRRVGDRIELMPPRGEGAEEIRWWITSTDGGGWIPGPNFGDAGMGYVFVDPTTDPPRALLFSQSS